MKLKILCIGTQWRGSDDGSLFRAFSRAGHLINIADEKYFVPAELTGKLSRGIRKLTIGLLLKEFNQYISQQAKNFVPDLVFVYKGTSVFAETLKEIKKSGIPIICVYPDTSFYDQGKHIPDCISYYDFVFTTKSFGIRELKERAGFTKAVFIQHCVDPDIHRPVRMMNGRAKEMECETSFIGTYSPRKNEILSKLIQKGNDFDIKIWGFGWNRSGDAQVKQHWNGQPIYGDAFSLAINSSKINLGLLYEGSGIGLSGDLITSRTFHIPGAGGFLLHERNEEFLQLFKEGHEAECFSNTDELVDKINFYRRHDEAREKIALQGHKMVMSRRTSDHRVKYILNTLVKNNLLSPACIS